MATARFVSLISSTSYLLPPPNSKCMLATKRSLFFSPLLYHELDDFQSHPALLVMFICNHCPFVIHLKQEIVKLNNYYMKKGLAVVAISSNSVVTHPRDGPEYMAEEAKLFNYPFPYLYDESQDVARAFGAVCTPEFLLYRKVGRRPLELVYHGQFDDSRPNSVLSEQPLSFVQKPSVGCSIKWHPEKNM
ncbi:hypothetical protein MKX01_009177 [Papaver californicum]|nr:hypothetical protein MKX01_009177 [Papaver californicum]